jgi:parvulin-like peptidyl-prolyl isomerase
MRVVLAIVTGLALASPRHTEAAPVGAVAVLDRVVARVGGVAIWQSELDARARMHKDARDEVLSTMIDEQLIVAEGRRTYVTVEKSEVALALEEIKLQNALTDKELDDVLAKEGFTRDQYLVDLERQLLILRTKNQLVLPRITISDAAVDAEVAARQLSQKVLTADEREMIRKDLRNKAMERETPVWLAELRKKTLIERKP